MQTTIDTLFNGALTLEQPKTGYRFGTDAVMLAAHLDARIGEHILDMGCGIGAVMLSIARRLNGVEVTGIDIQPDLIELTNKNIHRNDFDKRAIAVAGNITDKQLFKDLGTFDHVVMNPPYYKAGNTQTPKTEHKKLSHTDVTAPIGEWITSANRFLNPKGTLSIIYPTEFLAEILPLIDQYVGGITLTPIWPKPNEPSNRIIIQGTKGSKAPLRLTSGIVIHNE